jgi:hypothetical protein
MASEPTPAHDPLTARVTDGLRVAMGHVSRLRKTNLRLVIASFACSLGTTLVAGVTAVQGPVVGEGIPGWRLACLVASGLGSVSAVLTGLGQQMKLTDKRAEALQCVGQLKAIEASLATGSRPRTEVAKEYEEVIRRYPEYLG